MKCVKVLTDIKFVNILFIISYKYKQNYILQRLKVIIAVKDHKTRILT